MKGRACVPVSLHLRKQLAGQIWPVGSSFCRAWVYRVSRNLRGLLCLSTAEAHCVITKFLQLHSAPFPFPAELCYRMQCCFHRTHFQSLQSHLKICGLGDGLRALILFL